MKKVAIVLAVVFINSIAAAEELTYLDLIKRLTDLERLAMLPAPGETCGQCSSFLSLPKISSALTLKHSR